MNINILPLFEIDLQFTFFFFHEKLVNFIRDFHEIFVKIS